MQNISEEKVLELYKNYSITKISKMLNTSFYKIKKILIKRKKQIINRQNTQKISLFEAEILLNKGWSLEKIGKEYKCSPEILSKKLKKKGVNIINKQNERNTNQYIFNKINTEEKAYWLGFLYADGNISKNFNNTISLALKESDLNHLKKFKKFTNSINKIKYNTNTKSYRFDFSSKKIREDLINLGCIPKKSLILKFPTEKQVPKHLVRHFIRGYFDGDGCLTYSGNNKKNLPDYLVKAKVSIIGTLPFLKKIDIIFEKNNYIVKSNPKGSDLIFDLRFSLKKSKEFLNYIYNDSNIYLNRKYKRYEIFNKNQFAVLKSNFQNN